VDEKMGFCETAVRYQMYHVAALLSVGLLSLWRRTRLLHIAGFVLLSGVVGFCGGLYLMVFAGRSVHWAIVPSGGLLLIVGWAVLAAAAFWLPAGDFRDGRP
jgi:uncharacterized membrane protein YgdD (TMEM256/DUF423 family)